ncbi:NOG1 family protein [Methanosphaerula subterraneus]|uniref:NOG1 family protein n=1 Tax=Methanosphaerula subterraneus TaxID=3350244 RepID=UPI003F84616B
MEFEKMPTIPTADEILDRSFRRAAAKMKEKRNKDRANNEFLRAVTAAVHDRLVSIIQKFPEMEALPPFYYQMVDILYGVERLKKALGAVGWAAKNTREKGYQLSAKMRRAEDKVAVRKQGVARIASIVHQVDGELRFLNEVRNVLRKLPHVSDEYTVVVAGYPNVGKSSFIQLVSTAAPEVAAYPFTTKGVILGHRIEPAGRVQFVDTPGILDRPVEERNPIEKQALCALMNIADAILFIIDASEHCGYQFEEQELLRAEVEEMVSVPMVTVVNKSDLVTKEGYMLMSTKSGEGVDEVLAALLAYQSGYPAQHLARSAVPVASTPDEETALEYSKPFYWDVEDRDADDGTDEGSDDESLDRDLQD